MIIDFYYHRDCNCNVRGQVEITMYCNTVTRSVLTDRLTASIFATALQSCHFAPRYSFANSDCSIAFFKDCKCTIMLQFEFSRFVTNYNLYELQVNYNAVRVVTRARAIALFDVCNALNFACVIDREYYDCATLKLLCDADYND